MLSQLYSLKLVHNQQGILFCFSGIISQNLLVEIGDNLKNKMKQKEESTSTTLKVFSIFIEQAQNILYYSAEKEHQTIENNCGSGIMIVGYEQSHYYVSCGNLVENRIVESLRQQLQALQQMDKEALKAYYKEQRKKDAPLDSKGAGLGFIDIARKTGQKLIYSFLTINEKRSFFILTSTISRLKS